METLKKVLSTNADKRAVTLLLQYVYGKVMTQAGLKCFLFQ